MLQEIIVTCAGLPNRWPMPVLLGTAAVSSFVGLFGARFSRGIMSLSMVTVGTVIGLHLPEWFGWGVDKMGTAFGAAILLGMIGYVLTVLCEGLLLSSLLSAILGVAVWWKMAPLAVWHVPHIDFSRTAWEIGYDVWLSLPVQINRALPVAIGVGAIIGTGLTVFAPKMGRSILFAMIGISVLSFATVMVAVQSHPEWLGPMIAGRWFIAGAMGLAILFASGVQRICLPGKPGIRRVESSDNSLRNNRFVASGPALQLQSGGASASKSRPGARYEYRIPGRIR